MSSTPQLTLETFLENLSARTPTPGGGSASALGGALGAALAHMAGVFTTANEKYKSIEPQVLKLLDGFTALRKHFVELIQKDIDAYAAYSKARALPKNSPEEKKARSAAIAAANEIATAVPEQIVDTGLRGFELLEALGAIVNPNLAGDVAVAAYFLEAAVRGAAIQVVSNCAQPDTEGVNARRRRGVAEKIARCQAARERLDLAMLKLLKVEC